MDHDDLIAQLRLRELYAPLKRWNTEEPVILARFATALKEAGIDHGKDLPRVLLQRIERPEITEYVRPPVPTRAPRPKQVWPQDMRAKLADSFRVATNKYTEPLQEGRFIRLAVARGIPEHDALHLIIDMGRDGHWRPRLVNGNTIWENGYADITTWTVHQDGR